ncbi:hypothetical protein TIFTF001_011971 [Ficus carica]|uniref:Uncharacterized protein n=1 Tax=Ficus carica TaxID=3494 RepID=A0AA88D5U4_FICCA|nr:hypothetical protein TIFTF001_011971 [Ficus carica]
MSINQLSAAIGSRVLTKLQNSVEPLAEPPIPKALLGVPGGLEVELHYRGVSDSYELSAHEAYLSPAAVLATAVVNWLQHLQYPAQADLGVLVCVGVPSSNFLFYYHLPATLLHLVSTVAVRLLTYSIDCPYRARNYGLTLAIAQPDLTRVGKTQASSLAIITFIVSYLDRILINWRSCTYLSCYVLRSAASPLGTAAGFLLLDEGHSQTLGQPKSTLYGSNLSFRLWPSNSDITSGYYL